MRGGVLHPPGTVGKQGEIWQPLLLEWRQGTRVTQHRAHSTMGSPATLCRQGYTHCTLWESLHPNPLPIPAPSQLSVQKLCTEPLGQCHVELLLNQHHCFKWAWMSLLVHPAPEKSSFIYHCEGCYHSMNSTVLSEYTAARWEHDLPNTTPLRAIWAGQQQNISPQLPASSFTETLSR